MDKKLAQAWKIIRAARRGGNDRLLWALEFYPAAVIYKHCLELGYVWVKGQGKWAKA
jgi:hypothetical protein